MVKKIVEDEDEVFRSTVLNAWVNSKMERDKSLLTLSSGGIGLLVTLLSFKDFQSKYELVFYFAALSTFTICIGSIIFIFKRNPDYLERLIKEKDVVNDKLLTFLDYLAVISFCVGIFSTFLIGIINYIYNG